MVLLVSVVFFISPAMASQGGVVHGWVYAADGKTPLTGVSLEILDASSGGQIASMSTNSYGYYYYEFPAGTSPNATFKVHAVYSANNDANSNVFSVSGDQVATINVIITSLHLTQTATPTAIAVPSPTATPTPTTVAPGSGVVQGYVVADDGKTPYHYVSVELLDASSGAQVGSMTTDYNGHFEFHISTGNGSTYKLHAAYSSKNDAYSDIFSVGSGQSVAKNVILPYAGSATTAPSTQPPINHSNYPTMEPGQAAGSVSGWIFSDNNSTPLSGAHVVILSAAGTSVQYSQVITTDSNGFYQFNNVNCTATAVYKIYVSAKEGRMAFSRPFKVESGNTTKINLTVEHMESGTGVPSLFPPTIGPSAPSWDNNTTYMPENQSAPTATHEPGATSSNNSSDLIGQITGFITSIVKNILP